MTKPRRIVSGCKWWRRACNGATPVAQKALDTLKPPLIVDDRPLHVGSSIGISIYPDDGADVDTLMRSADTAMYHAREKGRGNYQFFTPVLNQAAQRRLSTFAVRNPVDKYRECRPSE